MSLKRVTQHYAYGVGNDLIPLTPLPIIARRAPTTSDRAEIGTFWVDQVLDDAYILTRSAAGVSTWINIGGGTGTFNALAVTTTALIGTGLTVTTGNVTLGGLGLGVVRSSATGLLSSVNGTNGQLIIAGTGLAPIWASLTSGDGSVTITPGANTLNIQVTGATASTFPTDAGIATPIMGATTITGGTNIGTTGAGGAVTINLDASPSVAGSLTAGVDLNMTSGVCTITSTVNAANAIYLHANGGVNETINIFSDQGTGVGSINVHSDVGGLTFDSGLASADAINITASSIAGGIDIGAGTAGVIVDTTGAISLDAAAVSNFTVTGAFDLTINSTLGSAIVAGGEAVVDAVQLTASNAAGGVTVATGTGGMTVNSTNGIIALNSGTAAINIGTDAAAHAVTVGTTNTTGRTVIQSGTGDVAITSTDAIKLDSVGVLELNSSGAAIGIGSGADAFGINIGTGGAARAIIIGNNTGATSVAITSGTGDIGLTSTDDITLTAAGGDISLDGATVDINGTGGATSMTPAAANVAGVALALNARVGVATFTGQTPAAGADIDFDITNAFMAADKAVLATVSYSGAADADITIEGVNTTTAGHLILHCINSGAAQGNGNIVVTFWVLN